MDRALVRIIDSQQLAADTCRSTRRLLDTAFGGEFSEDDWQHALGGWHVVAGANDDVIGHAAVVERQIVVGTRQLRAGYVEAVAVSPARQRAGIGTVVMEAVGDIIRDHFDLGVLSTGAWAFYERLGWERWRGPTYVRRTETGEALRTADEDDGVMVLRGKVGDDIDLAALIMCDQRTGDSW